MSRKKDHFSTYVRLYNLIIATSYGNHHMNKVDDGLRTSYLSNFYEMMKIAVENGETKFIDEIIGLKNLVDEQQKGYEHESR